MDRAEAVALLKELINSDLIQPSLISIEKNRRGTYSLIMKIDGNIQAIRQFIAGSELVIEEDKKKGYCVIHRR